MKMEYIPSKSKTVQGKWSVVSKQYGSEWNIHEHGGGHGNWLLTKKSDVIIDGKSYREFILNHYGEVKLTKQLVEKFFEELANGELKLPE